MCESGLERKYRALGQGHTTLESSLHTNLAEHLNSEVGLGTIKNMETANEWIRHSFLFRRLAQNPHRYMSKEQPWKDGLDGMISKCINDLKDAELLTFVAGRSGELRSTEFGEIMSRVRIQNLFAQLQQLTRTVVLPQASYGKKASCCYVHYADSLIPRWL
jgi:ATP-dependent DNA helicase HFM1/MER3